MVYNDVLDLGWWPYVNSWLANKESKILVTTLTGLFEKDLPQILDFIMNNCNKLIPASETNLIISLCRLFDAIYGDGSEVSLVAFKISCLSFCLHYNQSMRESRNKVFFLKEMRSWTHNYWKVKIPP